MANRIAVDRVRSGGQVHEGDPGLQLRAGDVVAVAGRRKTLVEVLERPGSGLREVDDKELLDLPGDVVDVVVTNAAIDGRTLGELGAEQAARGVFLRRITRAGEPLGILPATKVQRGDVLTIVGSAANVARAVDLIGVADRATDVTDMFVVATAIVAGAMIGLPAVHFGNVEIGLSLPVGVLLGGLVCGWLRSVRPRWFGRIPGPTLWVFESIGLTGFVAVVGLNAGPDFVEGLLTSGLSLVVAGALDDHDPARDRRAGRAVGLQDAPGRTAGRGRRRLHGDAGARGGAGGRKERGAVDGLWSRLRGRQRAACDLGHDHRRDACMSVMREPAHHMDIWQWIGETLRAYPSSPADDARCLTGINRHSPAENSWTSSSCVNTRR